MLSVAAPTAYHIQRRISSREGALSGEQELDHTQLRDTIGAADFKRKQAAGTDQFPNCMAVQTKHLRSLLKADGIGVAGKHLGIGIVKLHIELKRSGNSVAEACRQIEKYAAEGIFTGLFSLVQIFVAMNPEETVYFANPGPEGQFNKSYYFHWADFYNEPMNDWKDVTTALLSIPMAHMLVGFYTVADGSDGILKVMRSYQYYAASKISDAVSKAKWENDQQRGGYVWHTTGSGKTMTSFKSAQLIASSKDADKVIFLMDRIELGTQSLKEYRNFAEENEEVQAMDDLIVLLKVLNLLHDLFENFGAVLWRIAVFYKADMNESVLTSGAVSFFIKTYTILVSIAGPFSPLNTFSGIMALQERNEVNNYEHYKCGEKI